MFIKPVAFINVEERKLEWAEPMTWHTPTIAKMDKIPLYTKPNDEPAAWFYYRPGETGTFMCADAEAMKGIEKDGWVTTPLYLHPAKEEERLLSNDLRFNFSERLINVLKAENVFTLAELLEHSESDLMKFPNFGRVSLHIIKEQLFAYDLRLAGKRSKK